MKQLSTGILIASVFLITSCKKESANTNNPPAGENTFIIDGKTYAATNVFYIESSNMIKAQRVTPGSGLNEVETVSVIFSDDELPVAGGDFVIVNDPYSPGDKTNNNQVSILATTFPYDYGSYVDDNPYNPVLSPQQHITVSITSNNKVNVKFSNIAVKDVAGKATTISGNFTQP